MNDHRNDVFHLPCVRGGRQDLTILEPMCQHPITCNLRMPFAVHAHTVWEVTGIGELYDAHAPAVYGAMVRVLSCTSCAEQVVERAFLEARSHMGVPRPLLGLLRTAIRIAVEHADPNDREALRMRLRVCMLPAPMFGAGV